ncbi:MAG: SbcC/MukB-like Walker B domain-containing protein [Saprospiraceae bacterium]
MIPIRLSLQGVFSYIEKQEIDFTGLTEAGLFGIFGKVGSGKSSIVDAITFVLYNNNFRISNQMAYNMMNLVSSALNIEYDFRVGDAKYRFTASGRRNKNNFEDVKITRGAYCWDNQITDWKPIENKAENILGLSYDDFKRAVIIPQGNFQEFLELKGADRNKMMQKLFSLERFDLTGKVKYFKSQNDAKINILDVQLAELGEVNSEQIESLDKELSAKQIEINDKQRQFNLEKAEFEQLIQVKLLIETAKSKEQQLLQLKSKAEHFTERQITLKMFRNAITYLKPLLDRQSESHKKESELAKSIVVLNEKIIELGIRQQQLRERESELKPQVESRADIEKKVNDLYTLFKIRALEGEIASLRTRKQNGELLCAENEIKVADKKAQKSGFELELAELNQNEIDIELITNVVNWFANKEELENQIEVGHQKLTDLLQSLQVVRQQKLNFNAHGVEGIGDKTEIEAIGQKLEEANFNLTKLLKDLIIVEQKISQKQLLQQHVHQLSNGDPCPLCGAIEHPDLLTLDANLEIELENNRAEQNEIQSLLRKIAAEKDALVKLDFAIKHQLELVSLQKESIVQLQFKLNEQLQKFVWTNYSQQDVSQVKQFQETYYLQITRKKLLVAQISELQGVIETNLQNLEKYAKVILDFDLQISANIGQLYALKETMSVDPENYNQEKTETLKNQAEALINYLREIEEQYEKVQKDLNEQAINLVQATTRLQGEIRSQEQESIKLQQVESDILQGLNQYAFEDIDKVRSLLESGIIDEVEQKAIDTYFLDLQKVQAEFNLAKEQVAGRTYNELQHQELQISIKFREQELNLAREQAGSMFTELERSKRNLERHIILQKERVELLIRAANIATFESLFKGQGFVNFASRVYLQTLVGAANERFQSMTHRQLQLQLKGDNSIELVDLLCDGKTRSLQTLSGGQKFQASLCLAISLADSISLTHRENFFFLDEGFGSLDKESMQIVFDTLLALRKENRVVGLISHVEEMQQEMDRYIMVHRDDTRGSWVEVV